jgi:hypothetical protein
MQPVFSEGNTHYTLYNLVIAVMNWELTNFGPVAEDVSGVTTQTRGVAQNQCEDIQTYCVIFFLEK